MAVSNFLLVFVYYCHIVQRDRVCFSPENKQIRENVFAAVSSGTATPNFL